MESQTCTCALNEVETATETRSNTSHVMAQQRVPVLLFAFSVAVIITNIFAPQTLIKLMAASFGLTPATTGFVLMIPFIGYAAGLFFLVPLADLLENRRLVLSMLSVAILSSLGIVFASSTALLFVLLFTLGASCSVIQVLIPSAAAMSAPENRGRIIGDIMSGLMIGILLSRPASSFLASFGGWKTFYIASTSVMAFLAAILFVRLPKRQVTSNVSYSKLIASLFHLFAAEPILRKRSITAAIAMAAFNIFWTSVVFVLTAAPFNLGPKDIALFALAGSGGAVVSPILGRLADRGLSKPVTLAAHVILFAAFGIAAFCGLFHGLPWVGLLLGLGLGAFLIDVGVLGDQTIGRYLINQLNPQARGRLNGIFVGIFFIGGAVGSAAAGLLWAWGGWGAVCIGGAAMAVCAFTVDRTVK